MIAERSEDSNKTEKATTSHSNEDNHTLLVATTKNQKLLEASAIIPQASSEAISDDVISIVSEEYPTDRGLFIDNVSSDQKYFILTHGSCRPTGPFPKNCHGRSFSSVFYNKKTKSGVTIETFWLCYSPKLDSVYCEPCWLFGSDNITATNWRSGICDWQGLSKKIKLHEKSNAHIQACFAKEQWVQNKGIDSDLEISCTKERNFWREVLERLINITLKLATNGVAFRGHRENFEENY